MDASRVDITYRPLRVGWVLHSEDREALRLAMRMSFCLVGGIYNPIILVDRPEAEDLVRLFRVDMLEAVGASTDALGFARRFPHLQRPISGPLFDPAQHHIFSDCQLLDVINGIRIWSEWSNWADWVGSESGLRQIRWSADDPLADVHLAEFGGYPARESIGRDYESQIDGWLPKHETPQVYVDPTAPLPVSLVSRHTRACFLADHGVQWRPVQERGWFHPGIYLGDGSSVVDLVAYWNIRAANVPVRFVDQTCLDRYHMLAPALTERTRRNLGRRGDHPTIWTINEEVAKSASSQIAPTSPVNLCRVDSRTWSGGAIQVPMMYLSETSALGVEAKARVTFSLPDRPYSTDDFPHQNLIASVKIDDPSSGPDKRETFGLPFLPEHNEAFARALIVTHDQLRVEPGSLGLVVGASQADKSVRAVPVWDLASILFEAAGFRPALSNGGLIAQQLVNQVGGFEGGRVFKIPGVRRLLRTYSATDSFTKHAALKLIGERDPDTGSTFADHHQLYIEPREPGVNLTSDAVFSYLVEKGVIRVGWDLSCTRCQLSDWVAIDELRQQHTCGYCGTSYDATRQLVETPMAFRRSGLLGIQRNAQGAVPVALVLQQLANNLSRSGSEALLLPSIELVDEDGEGASCETDLFGMFPHTYPDRPAVVIGECKDRDGEIDADDIAKLGKLSARLEATGLDVYILLSKLGVFSDSEIKLARSLNSQGQHRVILLTDQELEPYKIYDRHREKLQGLLYGTHIRDLALTSERIFPGLRASAK